MHTIAFIGFGEAAAAFAGSWPDAPSRRIQAFDIKTASEQTDLVERKYADYDAAGVHGCANVGQALAGANLLFSAVTADQAQNAARAAATHIEPDTLYLDINSCAPGSKRAAATTIEAVGACYVDVAVMSPVHPLRHHAPLLISGPHAARAIAQLQTLDMRPQLADGPIGTASAIKMIRSIMVKGLEALVVECVLSATSEGVDEIVLHSLEQTFPGFGWNERAAYMLERVMVHGKRRAAEMEEAAKTAAALGLFGRMASATAQWQKSIGELELTNLTVAEKADYRLLARKILAELDHQT